MSIKNRFSAQDLENIKVAVREAESKISGEIVPVFVERSGFYTTASHRAAIMGACLTFFVIILLDRYVPKHAIYDPLFIFIAVAVGGFAGAALPLFIDSTRRWFLSQKHMDEATRKKAESAFLQQEVFNTKQRTGIMIFVSFFEREVIVMADRGINKVVDQKEWDKLVHIIVDNIRKDKLVEGIQLAIRRSGEILLEKGFLQEPDDINELGDDLRLE